MRLQGWYMIVTTSLLLGYKNLVARLLTSLSGISIWEWMWQWVVGGNSQHTSYILQTEPHLCILQARIRLHLENVTG